MGQPERALAVVGGQQPAPAPLSSRFRFEPQTLPELKEWAVMVSQSGLIPKDYAGKPANIVIAVMKGAEIGLSPTQALDSYAVINGRASMWGDGMLAIVRAHPSFVNIEETVEGAGEDRVARCRLTREVKGERVVTERTFSVAEARQANLWTKDGPWKQYPQRMMQMRARGFALRDGAADVLRGTAMAEEVMDYPAETIDAATGEVTGTRAASIKDKLRAQAEQIVDAIEAPPPADEAVVAAAAPPAAPAEDDDADLLSLMDAPAAAVEPEPEPPYDPGLKSKEEILDDVVYEARVRGIAPADLRAFCVENGGLTRTTAPEIVAKLRAMPLVAAEAEPHA